MEFTEIKERIADMQSQLDAVRKGGVAKDYYENRLALANALHDNYDVALEVYNTMVSEFASRYAIAASRCGKPVDCKGIWASIWKASEGI